MFLNEPHRTTRNYAGLAAKVGKEIFVKGQRQEPYYAAAFTLYKLEYFFRSGRLERKFRPARFHILLAARMLGNAEKLPPNNSRDMEKYCKVIMETLWDTNKADALILKAANVVAKVAGGNFDRDNIRTDPFTQKVIAECASSMTKATHKK
jgi:hypothetical protein